MEIGNIKLNELSSDDKRNLIQSFLEYCAKYAKYMYEEELNIEDFGKQSQYFEIEMNKFYKDFYELDVHIKQYLYKLLSFYVRKEYKIFKVIYEGLNDENLTHVFDI
jgi:hypothetical protein